jgi:hypothetical protein
MANSYTETIASFASALRDDYSKEELALMLAEYALNDVMTDRTQGKYGDPPPACRARAELALDKPPEQPDAPAQNQDPVDEYTADGIYVEWAALPEVAARLRTVNEKIVEDVMKNIRADVERELQDLHSKFSKSREHAAHYRELPQKYGRALMAKLDRCAALLRAKMTAYKAPEASDKEYEELFACHMAFQVEMGTNRCDRPGVQFISPDDEYQAFRDMIFEIGYLTGRCMTFEEFKEQMAKDRPVTSEDLAAIHHTMNYKLSMYEQPRKRKK